MWAVRRVHSRPQLEHSAVIPRGYGPGGLPDTAHTGCGTRPRGRTHSTRPSSFLSTTTPKGSSENSTLYSGDSARLRAFGVSRGTS